MRILLWICFLCFQNPAWSAEAKSPRLTISGPGVTKSFSREDLLKMKDRRTLEVKEDPAYGPGKRTYEAVPLTELFAGLKMQDFTTLSFKCTDGFSGAMSIARVLNKNPEDSIAYLAVEPAAKKWPALKRGKPETAGPFFLIWDHPEKSKIMAEEWPYQLSGFELSSQSLQAQFPKTVPTSPTDSVRRGYDLFMTNCFVCHAFNGEGNHKIGPDLNLPKSPSEYLQFPYFEILVRNPQELRAWPQARMPGFSSTLSEQDLKDLWAYFQHMAQGRTF